ncbi:succinylglutamic-5-semialdehyde dehydrogenase [Legionella beliardensis]|uniref:N-succinylglutamate 5-semialdehyde dehydrogenase n=1 Tax=Legionella beliardensis TaxID=91822 RepID=A0A378I3I2_9GAMM|nr:succinylglutamate-semialdehyde dehydrogenase [Legionella beliardensis]STX29261.1 succinylglutamic-5-semialdehyde dehydrogenase [Legionella beliardensis]
MTFGVNENLKGCHYLNGHWRAGTGEMFTSQNPLNGDIIWRGTQASKEEVNEATEAAQSALAAWSDLNVNTRSSYLQAFAEQVDANRQTLIELIALETGKPLWESATEVNSVIAKIKISIQAYQERTADKCTPTPEANACLRYKPHGVVAVFGAFNFPAHLSNGHIVPALLAGNTVVYKPSELAPGVAEFIMQCWHNTNIPAGVINCVQGAKSTGEYLLQADIQGVYFTGSYQVGKLIHRHFSERPEVILALEMGGNNPLIIDDVKEIEAAVYQTILSTIITAGQRCSCARRVIIKDNAFGDDFLNLLITSFKKIKVGGFTDKPEPFMGPVISYEHAIHHLKAQENLIKLGGNPLLKMSLLAENSGLLSPALIDMTTVANPPDEEIFAPLVQIYRYQHFEDALNIANQTRYGLAAGLFSDSKVQFDQFYKTVRAGLINWNRATTGASSSLPFGGIGCSGNHRPSAYFAADYCAYPIASLEQPLLAKPAQLLPGIALG